MTGSEAIQRFGASFQDYLISAEVVSRGTGPAKFLDPDAPFQNTIIFDTSLLEKRELPYQWGERAIDTARGLGLIHPDQRSQHFEGRYSEARRNVWERDHKELYAITHQAAMEIQDPLLRAIRISDLESVKANYDLAGFHLDALRLRNLPSFMAAQMVITGDYHVETTESLNALADGLSRKLADHGFKEGTLKERIDAMERRLGYIPENEVVETYETLVREFGEAAINLLDVDTDYLDITVEPLAKTEKKTGSFEYEGNGKAVTSVRVSDTMTFPRAVHLTAHEMSHLLTAIMREMYFRQTGDLYASFGTMCTSSAALDEGIGEMGIQIYRDVVEDSLRDDAWIVELLSNHARLKHALVSYTGRVAYERLYLEGRDPSEVADELEQIHLRYGLDDRSARVIAEGFVDPQRQHKSMFYTPHYAIGKSVVEEEFSRFPTFDDAFQAFRQVLVEKGPLTLTTLSQALSEAESIPVTSS